MGSIAIVGMGGHGMAHAADLPVRIREADRVVVPGPDSQPARVLREAGIVVEDLVSLGVDPDAPASSVIEQLVELSGEGSVVYVPSGFPFMREGLLSGLLARNGVTVEVFPSLSALDVMLLAFDMDLTADLDIVDVRSLDPDIAQRDSHLVVTGVRNRALARRVSERLARVYPAEHRIVLAVSEPGGGFELTLSTVEGLAEADVVTDTAVFVPPSRIPPPAGFDGFVRLIETLRGPDGCPWDRAQDHLSLRRHMIEEAYEAVAAIETGDDDGLADELGDVLLQVVLHAQIAAEDDRFDIDDVVARISEKIRRRHPHVFGDARADTPAEVVETWAEVKRQEKEEQAPGAGVLHAIPPSLPALMLAQKISRRVVDVGFEWETLDAVWEKVHEEIDELKQTEPGSPEAAEEIGDLLFTVVNLARKQGIDAEEALRATCAKFSARWGEMERVAGESGTPIHQLGIEGLERLWQDAKEKE